MGVNHDNGHTLHVVHRRVIRGRANGKYEYSSPPTKGCTSRCYKVDFLDQCFTEPIAMRYKNNFKCLNSSSLAWFSGNPKNSFWSPFIPYQHTLAWLISPCLEERASGSCNLSKVNMSRALSTHTPSNCVQGSPWLWTTGVEWKLGQRQSETALLSECRGAQATERCPASPNCTHLQWWCHPPTLSLANNVPKEQEGFRLDVFFFLPSILQILLDRNMAGWYCAKGDLTVIHRLSLKLVVH